MQEELAKLLGKGCELPHNKNQLDHEFHRHVWDLKIKDAKTFKERLFNYKEKHQDVDISADDINVARTVLQYLVYVAGGIASATTILHNLHTF